MPTSMTLVEASEFSNLLKAEHEKLAQAVRALEELASDAPDLIVFGGDLTWGSLPRETLARDVWKETARTTPLDNVIDVHIARLRRKVDADQGARLIHTVRGVGFMLREGEP